MKAFYSLMNRVLTVVLSLFVLVSGLATINAKGHKRVNKRKMAAKDISVTSSKSSQRLAKTNDKKTQSENDKEEPVPNEKEVMESVPMNENKFICLYGVPPNLLKKDSTIVNPD